MSPKKSPNPFSVMDRMKDVGRFGRQVSTGYAGGMSVGLTDVPANAMGVPQSTGRDIGGIAGMFNPAGLAAKAGGLGVRMASKFLPKAAQKFAGGMAVRGVEGALAGGATQLGRSVEEGSVAPALQGATLGGAVGGAIPVVGKAIGHVKDVLGRPRRYRVRGPGAPVREGCLLGSRPNEAGATACARH